HPDGHRDQPHDQLRGRDGGDIGGAVHRNGDTRGGLRSIGGAPQQQGGDEYGRGADQGQPPVAGAPYGDHRVQRGGDPQLHTPAVPEQQDADQPQQRQGGQHAQRPVPPPHQRHRAVAHDAEVGGVGGQGGGADRVEGQEHQR